MYSKLLKPYPPPNVQKLIAQIEEFRNKRKISQDFALIEIKVNIKLTETLVLGGISVLKPFFSGSVEPFPFLLYSEGVIIKLCKTDG